MPITRYTELYSDTHVTLYRRRYGFSACVTGACSFLWAFLAVTASGDAESLLLTYASIFSMVCALVSCYCIAVALDRNLQAVRPGTHEYKKMTRLVTTSFEAQALKEQIENEERNIYGFDVVRMHEIARVESPSNLQ